MVQLPSLRHPRRNHESEENAPLSPTSTAWRRIANGENDGLTDRGGYRLEQEEWEKKIFGRANAVLLSMEIKTDHGANIGSARGGHQVKVLI